MVEDCAKHTPADNSVAQAVAKGIADGVAGAFAVVTAKEQQNVFTAVNLGTF